jgi:hypothetical protein
LLASRGPANASRRPSPAIARMDNPFARKQKRWLRGAGRGRGREHGQPLWNRGDSASVPSPSACENTLASTVGLVEFDAVSYVPIAASTGISALVGVVIGGAITIIGQVIVEVQRRRTARQDRGRIATGVGRLAWNEFWRTQGTLQIALTSGKWWPLNEQPRSELSNEDRRLLAEVVKWSQWSEITRSWRRLERLRWDRELIEGSGRALDLTDEERSLVEDAAESCERANSALGPLARYEGHLSFRQSTKDPRFAQDPPEPDGTQAGDGIRT